VETRRKEIGPVDLFRETPRNNCRACGFPTCLAYAVHVIVDRGDLALCPHLSQEARTRLGPKISAQQARGVYVRTEKAHIADEIARKLASLDFHGVAARIGGEVVEEGGEEAMRVTFLGRPTIITRSGRILSDASYPTPYERILIYNHMLGGGDALPRGRWASIDLLPGSISKRAELDEACEAKLAAACARAGGEALAQACSLAGGEPDPERGDADWSFRFLGFPRVPLLLLIWKGDEDFAPRAKLLMDETAGEYLDMDSVIVFARLLADRILEKIE
jgi:hypothetical protein